MDKASIRRHVRTRLYALDDDKIRQKSSIICENVIASIDWETLHRVSCYQSQPSLREVDTSQLIIYIRDNWPEIELDIVEPCKQAVLPHRQYELIIVPVLGFDSEYNRLGRGGGWYDRFLSTQLAARTIGLAFDCQYINSIPVEDFDVELAEVFTES